MPSVFGTRATRSAPSLDRMFSSSNGAPGKARGFEPVATMTCFAGQRLRLGAGDRDLAAAFGPVFTNEPRPWKNGDLVLLEEVEDAVVVLLHDGLLARPASSATSIAQVRAARCRGRRSGGRPARSSRDDCSSAFDGMQPTLVQVPPGAGPPFSFFHSSMQAVLKSRAARRGWRRCSRPGRRR